MIFRVNTYDPVRHEAKPNQFFIQSKGFNAGRPLKEPKRNSWVIECDFSHAFEVLTILWVSKKYDLYIGGSVIPFLRLHDFKSIALPYLRQCEYMNLIFANEMSALQNIDKLITITESKLKLIKSLKICTAAEVLKKIDAGL